MYYNERPFKEGTSMKVINKSGAEIDFEASINYMDDAIREELNTSMAPCSNQAFFSAYEEAHAERYGEEWELSKANPTW